MDPPGQDDQSHDVMKHSNGHVNHEAHEATTNGLHDSGHCTRSDYTEGHGSEPHSEVSDTGHTASEIGTEEQHVPLHKTVCCVLCRKKEERIRRRMQESSATASINSKVDLDESFEHSHLPCNAKTCPPSATEIYENDVTIYDDDVTRSHADNIRRRHEDDVKRRREDDVKRRHEDDVIRKQGVVVGALTMETENDVNTVNCFEHGVTSERDTQILAARDPPPVFARPIDVGEGCPEPYQNNCTSTNQQRTDKNGMTSITDRDSTEHNGLADDFPLVDVYDNSEKCIGLKTEALNNSDSDKILQLNKVHHRNGGNNSDLRNILPNCELVPTSSPRNAHVGEKYTNSGSIAKSGQYNNRQQIFNRRDSLRNNQSNTNLQSIDSGKDLPTVSTPRQAVDNGHSKLSITKHGPSNMTGRIIGTGSTVHGLSLIKTAECQSTKTDNHPKSSGTERQLPGSTLIGIGGSFRRPMSSTYSSRLSSLDTGLNELPDDAAFRRYGSFRGRDPTASLRPITDPFLLQRLHGTSTANTKLTPKDEKMLSRLLARREQEQQMSHQRELSHRQWEEERKLVTSLAILKRQTSRPPETPKSIRRGLSQTETKYASSSSHGKDGSKGSTEDPGSPGWASGEWQLDEEGQARSEQRTVADAEKRRQTTDGGRFGQLLRPYSNNGDLDSASHPDGEQVGQLRNNVESRKSVSNEHSGSSSRHSTSADHDEYCHRCSTTGTPSQSDQKQKSKKQLQVALDRKKNVEQRLEEQRQKTEKYVNQLIEKQKQDVERANSAKLDRKQQITQKLRLKSIQQIIKQAKSGPSSQLARTRDEDAQSLHSGSSQSLSETGIEANTKTKKDEELSKTQADLQSKLEKSRLKQREMEEELRNWHEQILLYRQMQDKQAEALANAQMAKKREATLKEREEKERIQKKNWMRMQAQEDERKATLKAAIISKDERSRMIQIEKNSAMQKSRELADVTRRMREELRLN